MARRYSPGGELDPAGRRRFWAARRSDPASAARFDRLTVRQKREIVRTFARSGRRKGAFGAEVAAAREANLAPRRKAARLARAIAHFNAVRARAGVTESARGGPLRDPDLDLLTSAELAAVPSMDWEELSDLAARREDDDGEDFAEDHRNPYWYHR